MGSSRGVMEGDPIARLPEYQREDATAIERGSALIRILVDAPPRRDRRRPGVIR